MSSVVFGNFVPVERGDWEVLDLVYADLVVEMFRHCEAGLLNKLLNRRCAQLIYIHYSWKNWTNLCILLSPERTLTERRMRASGIGTIKNLDQFYWTGLNSDRIDSSLNQNMRRRIRKRPNLNQYLCTEEKYKTQICAESGPTNKKTAVKGTIPLQTIFDKRHTKKIVCRLELFWQKRLWGSQIVRAGNSYFEEISTYAERRSYKSGANSTAISLLGFSTWQVVVSAGYNQKIFVAEKPIFIEIVFTISWKVRVSYVCKWTEESSKRLIWNWSWRSCANVTTSARKGFHKLRFQRRIWIHYDEGNRLNGEGSLPLATLPHVYSASDFLQSHKMKFEFVHQNMKSINCDLINSEFSGFTFAHSIQLNSHNIYMYLYRNSLVDFSWNSLIVLPLGV